MSSDPGKADRVLPARVAVVGLGVMGGSLARALAPLGIVEIRGWSPRETERAAALEAGVVHEAPEYWEEAVEDALLVVLATPLSAVCELLPRVGRAAPGAVLTDVASLKAPVQAVARRAGLADRWVGSHPMTGSEGRGFARSTPDLYRGARIWMVADEEASEAQARVAGFWRALDAEPVPAGAEEHDRLMALASHLPQLVSNALARTLEEAGVSPRELGPGGLDMTRLAASSPGMWADLLEKAPRELPEGLEHAAEILEELARMVRHRDVPGLTEVMEGTRRWTLGAPAVRP